MCVWESVCVSGSLCVCCCYCCCYCCCHCCCYCAFTDTLNHTRHWNFNQSSSKFQNSPQIPETQKEEAATIPKTLQKLENWHVVALSLLSLLWLSLSLWPLLNCFFCIIYKKETESYLQKNLPIHCKITFYSLKTTSDSRSD